MHALSKSILPYILMALMVSLLGCDAKKQQFTPVKSVKWNPGHYVRVFRGTNLEKFLPIIDNQPYFKGIQVMHGWPELEKSKGVYDFSSIEKELAILKAHNKRMILQVVDKVFHEKLVPCVPDYLISDPVYKGGQAITYTANGRFKQCVAQRWVPEVQDRLIALYAALGMRFDKDPTLEAVMTTEGAVMAASNNLVDFSRQGYALQQVRGMESLAKAFPSTVVYYLINWGGREVGNLFEHAYRLGIGIGGPDLMPTHPTTAYPYYRQYTGKMPLAISAQLAGKNRRLVREKITLEQLYDFGITSPDGLRVNHIIWDASEKRSETSFVNGIIPLVNSRQGYINDDLPANRNR